MRLKPLAATALALLAATSSIAGTVYEQRGQVTAANYWFEVPNIDLDPSKYVIKVFWDQPSVTYSDNNNLGVFYSYDFYCGPQPRYHCGGQDGVNTINVLPISPGRAQSNVFEIRDGRTEPLEWSAPDTIIVFQPEQFRGGSNDFNSYELLPNTSFVFQIEAIPEPSSWALMIGGFALAGAASRRQKAMASYG
jgi:hypothetical protein